MTTAQSITTPLTLRYGSQTLTYTVVSRDRQSLRVLIKVHPDCRIEVSAPPQADLEQIQHAVKQRARWIYKRWQQFSDQIEHVTPRQYISGESHYYLGRKYLLKVISDSSIKPQVKLLRGRFEVTINSDSDRYTQVSQLMKAWYKERAKVVFQQRLDTLCPQILWLTDRPPFRLLSMQTQWGSCSPQGLVTLNPNLIKAKRDAIDYVLLHELCHLAEHNHSDRFYRLVAQVMPNWEQVKFELDAMAHELLL